MLKRLQFPKMLRKMWAGHEVQAWLDHQVPPEVSIVAKSFEETVFEWSYRNMPNSVFFKVNDVTLEQVPVYDGVLDAIEKVSPTDAEALCNSIYCDELSRQFELLAIDDFELAMKIYKQVLIDYGRQEC